MILTFYCNKEGIRLELDTIIQCSTEIHGADAGIACRILMIYFGRFLQMTYNLHNTISVFNSMRQQNESMLRKHFVTRCMITKRISKKTYKF